MAETLTLVDVAMREVGYDTYRAAVDVLGFEDNSVAGFVVLFDNVATLLATWSTREEQLLMRYASGIRASGSKAWNIYTVLLTAAHPESAEQFDELTALEENLKFTRKLAKSGVDSIEAATRALQSLLPIQSVARLGTDTFESHLKIRMATILGDDVARALLADRDPAAAARKFLETRDDHS